MQYVFRLHKLAVEIDVGIRQVDCEERVVIADGRAQQQRLFAVQQQFEVREISRVAKENAVGAPTHRADICIAVEHREAIALLERAARARRGSCARNIEGCFRDLIDQLCGRGMTKQREASDRFCLWRPAEV